jgi:hypothetical protein
LQFFIFEEAKKKQKIKERTSVPVGLFDNLLLFFRNFQFISFKKLYVYIHGIIIINYLEEEEKELFLYFLFLKFNNVLKINILFFLL